MKTASRLEEEFQVEVWGVVEGGKKAYSIIHIMIIMIMIIEMIQIIEISISLLVVKIKYFDERVEGKEFLIFGR